MWHLTFASALTPGADDVSQLHECLVLIVTVATETLTTLRGNLADQYLLLEEEWGREGGREESEQRPVEVVHSWGEPATHVRLFCCCSSAAHSETTANSSCSPSALMSSFKTHQTHNVEKNHLYSVGGQKSVDVSESKSLKIWLKTMWASTTTSALLRSTGMKKKANETYLYLYLELKYSLLHIKTRKH